MSRVTYDVCDRCKKKVSGSIVRVNRIRSTYIFGRGPYDYIETKADLCEACGKDLEKFMEGVKE